MRYTNINLCLSICFLGSDFREFILNLHTHGTDLRLFIAHHKLVHTPLHFIAMQLPGDQYQHAPWYHPPAVMTFLKSFNFEHTIKLANLCGKKQATVWATLIARRYTVDVPWLYSNPHFQCFWVCVLSLSFFLKFLSGSTRTNRIFRWVRTSFYYVRTHFLHKQLYCLRHLQVLHGQCAV